MTRNAVILQTTLVLTLTLTLISSIATAELMNAIPLPCAKEQCPCESPVCARPNDYCGKPIPCVPCLPGCRRCDDHCRKGIPCIPCLPQSHRCNDYRRKCVPPLCPIRLIRPAGASSGGDGENTISFKLFRHMGEFKF